MTVLTDDKIASDKPSDSTLRLTLIRTPGTRGGYEDQGTQDWGHHEIVFGLAGHQRDWRQGQTDWQAYRLNEPLIAFDTSKHTGSLGKEFSLLKVSNSRVRLMALKKAEESDEVIIRLVEMSGQDAPNVRVTLATPLTDAREMNGQEQPVGPATVNDGELVTSFTAYQPRTIAVKLAPPASKLPEPVSQPVELTYDASVATFDGKPGEGCFDCNPNIQDAPQGKALPAEMLPSDIAYAGVHFHLAPGGSPDAVTARGQTIPLPEGKFNRLYILAASYGGDQTNTFGVSSRSTVSHVSLPIEDWTGFIGQWDTRKWNERRVQLPVPPEPAANDKSPAAERARRIRAEVKEHGPTIETHLDYTGLEPGYIKRAPVAWFASHRHSEAAANEPYDYSYLFAYTVDLPAGSNSLMLPNNPHIRILAASVSDESSSATPVQPLYDTLDRANVDMSRWQVAKGSIIH